MALSTADAYASVEPVKRKFYGLGYKAAKSQFQEFVEVDDTEEPIMHAVEYGGHGQFTQKTENSPITMGSFNQSSVQTWRAATWAGGYAMSHELIKDSKLREIKSAPQMLGRAAKMTPDYIFAQFLDRAFNSAYPAGWDGLELCSTVHLRPDRLSTWPNEMATPLPLSEEAVESIYTSFRQSTGPDGMRSALEVDWLVVPAALYVTAEKLRMADREVGSANNTKSYVGGKFKVYPFDVLSSSTRYFAVPKAPLPSGAMGLFWMWRERPQFITDEVATLLQKVYLSFFRSFHGCEDQRGIFGVAATT